MRKVHNLGARELDERLLGSVAPHLSHAPRVTHVGHRRWSGARRYLTDAFRANALYAMSDSLRRRIPFVNTDGGEEDVRILDEQGKF